MNQKYDTSLSKMIEASGGRVWLASKLGVTPQAIMGWIRADRIPAERVIEIERVTGMPREALRPDLYPQRRQ
jgi:DNA-binding transcriptional regulator YdaS (Cro superfamily)